MNIKDFLLRHTLILQLMRFGVVGTTAFLIDTATFWILIHFFDVNSHLSIAIAFTVSLLFNYVLSVKWVFNPKEQNHFKRLFVFTVLSVIGLVLTEAIYSLIITYIFNYCFSIIAGDTIELFAKVFASFIVMIYNFITRKIYLEKSRQ